MQELANVFYQRGREQIFEALQATGSLSKLLNSADVVQKLSLKIGNEHVVHSNKTL